MTPNDVKLALHEVLANGVSLNATAYLVVILGWIVAGALGAFLGAFFGKRGETAGVKRDIETIKDNVRQTTAATEEIRTKITGEAWLRQKRLEIKWECYAEIVENLGELHSLISEAIGVRNRGPNPGQDKAAFDSEVNEKISRAEEAFQKARRFGSKARLAVTPEARIALTEFGNKWNSARSPVEQGTIARNAWMEITDIGRNEVFGEPREMQSATRGAIA